MQTHHVRPRERHPVPAHHDIPRRGDGEVRRGPRGHPLPQIFHCADGRPSPLSRKIPGRGVRLLALRYRPLLCRYYPHRTFCTLKCNMWGPVWTLATCRSRSRSCSRRRTTRSFFSTTTTWRGCNFSSPWPIRPRLPRSLLKSDDYTMEDLAFALAYPSPYCETNIRGVKFIGGDKKNYSVPIDEYTVALQHIITKRGTTPLAVVHLMGGHLALEDCACSNADYLRYVHFLISMCHGRKVDEPYTNFLLPNGQPKFFVKPTNKLNTAPQTITIVYKKGLVFPPDSNAFGKARVAKTNEQVRGLGFPAEMTIDSSGRPDIARRISAWIVRPGMRLPHLCAICGLADHLDKDCKFGGDCP